MKKIKCSICDEKKDPEECESCPIYFQLQQIQKLDEKERIKARIERRFNKAG